MFWEAPRNKLLIKSSPNTFPHKSYLQSSKGGNWNTPHRCACAGINFVLFRKVHKAESLKKNTKNVEYLLLRLYRRGLNSSNSQVISL